MSIDPSEWDEDGEGVRNWTYIMDEGDRMELPDGWKNVATEQHKELVALRARYAQAIHDLQGIHAHNLDLEKRTRTALSDARVASAQRDSWFEAKEEAERKEFDTFKALGYVLKQLGGRVEISYRDLVGVAGGITSWKNPQKSVLVLRWDDPSGRP